MRFLSTAWKWAGHISLVQWLLSGGGGVVTGLFALSEGTPLSLVLLTSFLALASLLIAAHYWNLWKDRRLKKSLVYSTALSDSSDAGPYGCVAPQKVDGGHLIALQPPTYALEIVNSSRGRISRADIRGGLKIEGGSDHVIENVKIRGRDERG